MAGSWRRHSSYSTIHQWRGQPSTILTILIWWVDAMESFELCYWRVKDSKELCLPAGGKSMREGRPMAGPVRAPLCSRTRPPPASSSLQCHGRSLPGPGPAAAAPPPSLSHHRQPSASHALFGGLSLFFRSTFSNFWHNFQHHVWIVPRTSSPVRKLTCFLFPGWRRMRTRLPRATWSSQWRIFHSNRMCQVKLERPSSGLTLAKPSIEGCVKRQVLVFGPASWECKCSKSKNCPLPHPPWKSGQSLSPHFWSSEWTKTTSEHWGRVLH